MSSQAERRKRALINWLVINSISANALSLAAGKSRAFVSSHTNDHVADMKVSNWEALAAGATKLLGREVTVGELQGDDEQAHNIEIGFKVGAGAEIHPIDGDAGFGHVKAPPGFIGAACKVVGDSGVPMFEPGDVLFIAPAEKPGDRMLGKVMVVRVKDGPVLVKRVMRGSRKGRYDLQSINPGSPTRTDEILTEAAAIRWIKRAG